MRDVALSMYSRFSLPRGTLKYSFSWGYIEQMGYGNLDNNSPSFFGSIDDPRNGGFLYIFLCALHLYFSYG